MFFVVKLVDLLKFSMEVVYWLANQERFQMKTHLSDQELHFGLERQ